MKLIVTGRIVVSSEFAVLALGGTWIHSVNGLASVAGGRGIKGAEIRDKESEPVWPSGKVLGW